MTVDDADFTRAGADLRRVIVVGASAGGVEALQRLVAHLPARLPAALLVVMHIPAEAGSALPTILTRAGPLPAAAAHDGDALVPGRILVAPPDRHLIVYDGRVVLNRGPRENGVRPSIDVLFRTAARAFGPRAVAVLLSGALDDGVAGGVAVARAGGVTIAQDPDEAMVASMPRHLIKEVDVDHVLPAAEIGPVLTALCEATGRVEYPVAVLDPEEIQPATEPVQMACPDCGGPLRREEDHPLRFRCHTGHAWTAESLAARQAVEVESALWYALRALAEKSSLSRRMSASANDRGDARLARRFADTAAEADQVAKVLRGLLGELA